MTNPIQCPECKSGVQTEPQLEREYEDAEEYDVKILCKNCDWSTWRPNEVKK